MINRNSDSSTRNAVTLHDIKKSYPGVNALRGISMEVKAGEIVALVGANGAGKSTLMKILSGAEQPDSGTIVLFDQESTLLSPRHAQERGVSTVFQELMLVPELSIVENVFLGNLQTKRFGLIDWKMMCEGASAILKSLGLIIDVSRKVKSLSIAQMQLVEIAKAMTRKTRVLIMDEPTAPLTREEAEALFANVQRLRSDGMSVIFITHHLEEIFKICDRVFVMRDGALVGEAKVSDIDETDIVRMMLGRKLQFARRATSDAHINSENVFSCHNICSSVLQNVSLNIRKGEIVGIAGLMGAGRTELLRILAGVDKASSGSIKTNGKVVTFSGPARALAMGVGLAPEDRKHQGLILSFAIEQNISLASMKKHMGLLGFSSHRERDGAIELRDQLEIKCANVSDPVSSLSGGNQQKVVLAKLLRAGVALYLLDEPTRGVDVGAKSAIFDRMRSLAREGASILIVSSAIDELLEVCDRVICMHLGALTAEYSANEFNMDNIMLNIMGKIENDSRKRLTS